MAAQTMELLSGTLTGDSVGAAFPVPTITMLHVFVNISAASGSGPTLDLWLQGSADDGTTWFDLTADHVQESADSDTAVAAATNKRDICDAEADATDIAALYKHLACDLIRIKYKTGGTTPSYTVLVKATGK